MGKKNKGASCCSQIGRNMGCCKVESLISVDERGQMVLPKKIRDKAGIRPGDKLAVVNWERGGKLCCISLVKVEELTGMVTDLLGPVMKEMVKKREVKNEK